MAAQPCFDQERISEAEYLELERNTDPVSGVRHEYVDGFLVAMVGASKNHLYITRDLFISLHQRLRGTPCSAELMDLRVQITASHSYTYPDISIICGEAQFNENETIATLLNPIAVVEVLSPSTVAYDRGAKFRAYQKIPALLDYIIVEQDLPRVEVFSRAENASEGTAWMLRYADGLEATITIPSLNISVPLAEIYDRVEFPPEEDLPTLDTPTGEA